MIGQGQFEADCEQAGAQSICGKSWAFLVWQQQARRHKTEVAELLSEMKIFVERVDAGEIRSKRTYAKFKTLIAKHEENQL